MRITRQIVTVVGLLSGIGFGLVSARPVQARQKDYPYFDWGKRVTQEHLGLEAIHGLPMGGYQDLAGLPVILYSTYSSRFPGRRDWLLKKIATYNDLYARYKDRGLVVLAIMKEPRNEMESAARELGIKHPFARAKSTDTTKASWTHPVFWGSVASVLIDSHSRVFERSDEKGVLAKFPELEGKAIESPVWDWPKSARDAGRLFRKRKFGSALNQARKRHEDHPEVVASLVRLLDGLVVRMYRDHQDGRHWRACDLAQQIVREWKGTPEASLAAELLDRYKADEVLRKLYGVAMRLRTIRDRGFREGNAKIANEVIPELAQIERSYGGTKLGTTAGTYRRGFEAAIAPRKRSMTSCK